MALGTLTRENGRAPLIGSSARTAALFQDEVSMLLDPVSEVPHAAPFDYGRVFDSLPSPHLLVRGDFTIAAVNESYLRVTGTDRDALIGKGLLEVFPSLAHGARASGIQALEESLHRVLSTRKVDRLPARSYDLGSAGGSEGRPDCLTLALINAPVMGLDGGVEAVILQVEVRTESVSVWKEADGSKGSADAPRDEGVSRSRGSAEGADARPSIEESEARFRVIANAMPQIVWTADPDGFVEWYNEWWYDYTGSRRGGHWDDGDSPMHPDDTGPAWRRWLESLASGEPYEMEYRFRRKEDGSYRWHLGRAIPAKDATGKIIKWIGTNTDVHDHKSALNRHEDERESRERFLATLTHDLRTPLTAAHMSAQMIGMIGNSDKEIMRFVAKMLNNLGRVDRMIQDMLDANRIRAGAKLHLAIGPCDLSDIAKQTVDELAAIHGARLALEQAGRITGHWNDPGLRRVLENLCTNAVKYGEDGRPITITLEEASEVVRIKVHNHGPPLSERECETLFDRFRRSSSAIASGQEGWGLGLTLVKGTAEAHGGDVTVESRAGVGTTFIVSLPRDSRPFQEGKAD